MPTTSWASETGDGIVAMPGGGVNPQYFFLRVTDITNPRIRVLGTAVPRRLQYAGVVGLANDDIGPSSTDDVEVIVDHNLNYESELWVPAAPLGFYYAQWFFWRLQPGQTMWWSMVY